MYRKAVLRVIHLKITDLGTKNDNITLALLTITNHTLWSLHICLQVLFLFLLSSIIIPSVDFHVSFGHHSSVKQQLNHWIKASSS